MDASDARTYRDAMPLFSLAARSAVIAAALTLAGCRASGTPEPHDQPRQPVRSETSPVPGGASQPIAVVELFTSQGCSSCPPADDLLRQLADGGGAVVPLSFHVDYWNRLGWADPYSDPAHTARQRAYAAAGAFGGRVYTPAMIVGGTGGFVGSQRQTARAEIAQATAPTATVRLAARVDGRTVTVEHAVWNAPPGARLHLALVQDGTAQDVTRGENRGRRLAHARVVRAFETVDAGRTTTTLTAPDDLDLTRARVVGYVQPGEVGPVLGAAHVHL